jgi:2,3-bisphosphoglycerate-dependent phosphoglycerate mutase
MDRLLVLARHGQSEWNLKNLFTEWKDVDLTEVAAYAAPACPASQPSMARLRVSPQW